MSDSRRSGGSYRERIVDNITDITPADFANPWNFFYLFTQSEEDVYFWCRQNGLLATSFPCHVDNCTGEMALAALSRAPGGAIFRCTVNRRHTKSSRSHSFFDKSNLVLQDIILFIKSYPGEEQFGAMCTIYWHGIQIYRRKLGKFYEGSV